MRLPQAWTRLRLGAGTWRVHPDFAVASVKEKLRAPEQLTAAPAEPLRIDARARSTLVVRATWSEFPDTPLVIKRYRPASVREALKEFLRPSRAWRTFERALQLVRTDIPTASPVAVGEIRRYRWLKESFLITEFVAQARPLRHLRAAALPSPHAGRVLMRALAALMARLHDAGLAHTDPTLSNFLVQQSDQGPPRLVLIDLDGIRRRWRRSLRAEAKDLRILVRRIPMSPREQLWFVAEYCRARSRRSAARTLIPLLEGKR